jgi:hypothetical protein
MTLIFIRLFAGKILLLSNHQITKFSRVVQIQVDNLAQANPQTTKTLYKKYKDYHNNLLLRFRVTVQAHVYMTTEISMCGEVLHSDSSTNPSYCNR